MELKDLASEERSRADFQSVTAKWKRRIVQSSIDDLILELQIRESNAVGEAARTKVEAYNVVAGDIAIVVDGETKSKSREQRVLEVRVAIKRLRSIAEVVVNLANEIIFDKRLAETGTVALERSSGQSNRSKGVLLVLSPSPKKNNLFLMIGPPSRAPYCERCE